MRYRWEGVRLDGSLASGEVEAASHAEAARDARGRGAAPLRLVAARPGREAPSLAAFHRGLAALARLGAPLPMALRVASGALAPGPTRRAMARVEAAVADGVPLAQAVASEAPHLPPGYPWLMAAGEASGDLAGVLAALARHEEGLGRAGRAVALALVYPVTVMLVAAGAGLGVGLCLEPLRSQLAWMGVEGPPGGALSWAAAPMAVALLAAALSAAMAAAATRSRWAEAAVYRLPVLGGVLRDLAAARLAATLEILLRGRVPLAEALGVAALASGSLRLALAAGEARSKLAEGGSLGEALGCMGVLPASARDYLAEAERVGSLGDAAGELAGVMATRADSGVDLLSQLLHPISLVVTGAAVAGFLAAVWGPWLQTLTRAAMQ